MSQPHPWGFTLPDDAGLDDRSCLTGPSRNVLAGVGLLATVYIEHGDTPEIREAMVRVYERYLELAGPVLRWGADPETFEAVSVQDTGVGDVRGWPTEIFQRFDFLMMFHGGADVDDADPHYFMAVSREREEGQLSFLTLSLSLEWAAQRPIAAYVEIVREVCDLLAPVHGYAGLGALAPVGGVDEPIIEAVYGLGSRFQGLEIDMPVHHESFLSSERRIKGVNWLTVLHDGWVERLGGAAALRDALGPAITVHRFSQGIILQAGAGPRLGDTRKGERLDAYRAVAKALEPIRSKTPAVIWPQNEAVSFGFDESKAWMSRFD